MINLLVTDNQLIKALDTMILSTSGWRKLFAPLHSTDTMPAAADRLLAVAAGLIWGRWLQGRLGNKEVRVLGATDTRPTGPVLASHLLQGLESAGCRTVYIGVAAAPEAMARSGTDKDIHAFAYVSASHNPVGYNGFKFGIAGGVLHGDDAKSLIADFRSFVSRPGAAGDLIQIAGKPLKSTIITDREAPQQAGLAIVRPVDANEKLRTLAAYKNFLYHIAGGPGDLKSQETTLLTLRAALRAHRLTIVADLNGSARCLSGDASYLEGLGVRLETFNDEAGNIPHGILPEGESLEPCRQALEAAHAKDPAALIGYVPDNDGDRGNLVIWDSILGAARILEAQEVFAISVLAELSSAAWGDTPAAPPVKTALVVNGPTSHRVRDIAKVYGTAVYEAEVGEANVVNRAAALRREGYRVRLLGEGSNGGTITYPAAVRDPLNTITGLLKLLRLPSTASRPGPFMDWCRRIGRPELCQKDFGPGDVAASLPVFTTTPTSAGRGVTTIKVRNHGALKKAWETIFAEQWFINKKELKSRYGFHSWMEVNNEGTSSRIGVGPDYRSGAESGGLKVVFQDGAGKDAGFIWMRGSGTEPVFRVMAEIRGRNPEGEAALIKWHQAMVAAADRQARGKMMDFQNFPTPY